MAHFEALLPSSTTSVWALVLVTPFDAPVVVAHSYALAEDVKEFGPVVDSCTTGELNIPFDTPPGAESTGFFLWHGSSYFDGLDDVSYKQESVKALSWEEAKCYFLKHEDTDPDEDNDENAQPNTNRLLDFGESVVGGL